MAPIRLLWPGWAMTSFYHAGKRQEKEAGLVRRAAPLMIPIIIILLGRLWGRLFQQEAKKSEYKYMSEQITAPERPVASGGHEHNYTRAIIIVSIAIPRRWLF